MTCSPHDDDEDDTSVYASVKSVETLPYNFDVYQLIDQRKKQAGHHSQTTRYYY